MVRAKQWGIAVHGGNADVGVGGARVRGEVRALLRGGGSGLWMIPKVKIGWIDLQCRCVRYVVAVVWMQNSTHYLIHKNKIYKECRTTKGVAVRAAASGGNHGVRCSSSSA